VPVASVPADCYFDGKIWVQYDDSEEGIATDLPAAGVPRQDIVLGFRPPELRQYTEFAVS